MIKQGPEKITIFKPLHTTDWLFLPLMSLHSHSSLSLFRKRLLCNLYNLPWSSPPPGGIYSMFSHDQLGTPLMWFFSIQPLNILYWILCLLPLLPTRWKLPEGRDHGYSFSISPKFSISCHLIDAK
jgi:hypothetical protein